MDAVILAAGRGARLNGHVAPYMKPLIAVNGVALVKTVTSHAVEATTGRVVVVAAPDNVVPISHLVGELERVTVIVQHTPRGPGDAVWRALDLCASDRVLILCADNIMSHADVQAVATATRAPFVVGTRVLSNGEEAERFTRYTEDGSFIEGAKGGVWSDGRYRCWVGPLVVPRTAMQQSLTAIFVEPGAELKIAPSLNDLGQPELIEVRVVDVGVPDALTRESLHVKAESFKCSWALEALLHAVVDLGYIDDIVCMHPKCLYDSAEFDQSAHRLSISFDHLFPRRLGGGNRLDNLRLVHRGCNSSYTDRSDRQLSVAARMSDNVPRGDEHWTRRTPKVPCPFCDYEGFSSRLAQHVERHHPGVEEPCES